MLRLPDSSLTQIFLHLDTSDYEQLRQVCRRFEPLVIACWRTKYQHWTRNHFLDYDDDENLQTFEWIAHNLGECLEKLDLKMISDEEMCLLTEFKFPQVKSLHVAYDCGTDKTQTIANAFPNLQKLSIEGNIDLDVISKMQNLTELNAFFYGHNAETHNFEAIFTGLRLRKLSLVHFFQEPRHYTQCDVAAIMSSCESLEDIALEPEFLALLLPKLDEFPKLKRIGLFNSEARKCDTNALFENIIALFGRRIVTLISEYLFPQYVAVERLNALCHLEKWILKDRSLRCGAENFNENSFRNLRELQLLGDHVAGRYDEDFSDENAAQDEYDPLPLIAACRNLEVLAVPRQWINKRLQLSALRDVLLKQSPQRVAPLELRYLEDDVSETNNFEPIEFDENSDLLHLTRATYPKEYGCFRPNCLSFQVILNS